MNRLEELRAKLRKLTAEMRQITDNPAANGEHSPEQNAKFDALKAEADSVEKLIERAAVLDELERRSGGPQVVTSGDARFDDLCGRVSLCRAIASTFETGIDAGLEKEVSTELARRTGKTPQGILIPHHAFLERRVGQVAANSVYGGALVPDQYRPDLIVDRLRNASVLSQLGVTTLSGLMGRVVIPKITGSTSVEWIGENEEATESDMEFGSMAISPKTVSGQVAMSRSLLMNSNPSIESLVRSDIAKIVAEAADAAALTGTGVKDPKGILNYTDLPTVAMGTDGAGFGTNPASLDKILDLIAKVDVANALSGNLKFLMNGKTLTTIARAKDTTGQQLREAATLPNSLMGYPVGRSNAVPSNLTKGSGTNLSALIYADWSQMILGYWGGLDILANPYSRAAKGAVLLHLFQDLDVGVRHIEGFAAIEDLITASL
ncbi:phage major capsid protein [Dongia sp.]|uniref:phage major capsid protein n=1 Tax=Dongia sp. TaxID=1977262 RepID=UPI0035AF36FE